MGPETFTVTSLSGFALHHIGVCIPTYKRPHLLDQLLSRLINQQTGGLFHYSVHVIDNDSEQSAETIVAEFARTVQFPVTYDVEPVQNIALARNRAVRCANGDYIAFIDDDEIPADDWLLELHRCCNAFQADGVLGPVRPLFASDCPAWLKNSRLCERPSYRTGAILNADQTRTGNVLFKRCLIDGLDTPFPADKGRTGGEDTEFFRSMMNGGRVFVWCAEATVLEHVTSARSTKRYYIDLAFRRGGLTGEWLRGHRSALCGATLKSIAAIFFHLAATGAGVILGEHIRVRHAAKTAWHLGQLFSSLGLPVQNRQDG